MTGLHCTAGGATLPAMRHAIPLLVLLAGCDPAPPPAPVPTEPQVPSAFQNQVAALAPGQRDAVLIRAIRDSRLDCQGVTESRPAATSTPTKPVWIARCTNGATYGVIINPDGTAGVVGAAN